MPYGAGYIVSRIVRGDNNAAARVHFVQKPYGSEYYFLSVYFYKVLGYIIKVVPSGAFAVGHNNIFHRPSYFITL